MQRIATVVIAVLASGWFVPVSCSTASAVLAQIGAADSERAWTPEQRPSRFHVVARPGEGDAALRVLTLDKLAEFKAAQRQSSFLMERDTGRIDIAAEHSWAIYRVLSRTPDAQEIEVDFEDGDDQMFSRYRATAAGVEPVSTRYGPVSRGILMGALFNGFMVAMALFLFAWVLKLVLRKRPAPPPSAQ